MGHAEVFARVVGWVIGSKSFSAGPRGRHPGESAVCLTESVRIFLVRARDGALLPRAGRDRGLASSRA